MTALQSRARGAAGSVAGALLAACLLAAGCSVDQEIAVRVNGAGEAQVRVELQPVFIDYLRALAEVADEVELPDDPSEALFDVAEVEAAIADWPGVEAARIATPTPEQLELELTFDDLQAAFAPTEAGAGTTPLISLTGSRRRTLSVHLDSDNYHQLTALLPVLEPFLSHGAWVDFGWTLVTGRRGQRAAPLNAQSSREKWRKSGEK